MFSILLVLFALLGLSLLFFLIVLLISPSRKCGPYINDDQCIEIVKVIEAHRKILPICSAQGWCLIASNSGLRCWKKEMSFVILGSPVTVYGCTKQMNCSAVIVLNVIADISTWPEWDFWAEGQTIHLEVAEDPALHGDCYMQCDQLVLTTTAMQSKPDVVMYRFGNLEDNGVGWILLWNAKHLEWTFYIAQPLDNCSDNKCVLTAISGFYQAECNDKTLPEKLCVKVQNLSEAIKNSHYKVRPLQPLMKTLSATLNNPHVPTIHSALNDLPKTPCVLLKVQKSRQINMLQNCVLAMRPVSSMKENDFSGFQLISRLLKEDLEGNSIADAGTEEKRRSRRRQKIRCDSVTSVIPSVKRIQAEERRSSSLTAPVIRKKLPEVMVTEVEGSANPPTRASSHSFLDLIFHRRRSSDASDKHSKSPAGSRASTPPRERKTQKKVQLQLSSASSQEDLSNNNVFLSSSPPQNVSKKHSVGDVYDEIITIQPFTGDTADYAALGEFCISSLLQENAKTSLLDIASSEEEQKRISGGWVFKETNKDVTVLKRTGILNESSVLSYLCSGLIPTSQKLVWKTLCDPLTRFIYDDTVKKISVLSELPSNQKLIHMYNESTTLLKKQVQDFCLLQTQKVEEGRYMIAFHSVDDELCPPAKDVRRGTVIASGWIIEKVPELPNATMVSYLSQMVISGPDCQLMEEISNVQCQCINSLSTYLAARPL